MAIALMLIWLACLAAYLCSKQQILLERPLGKLQGWGLFALLAFLGWIFMLGSYQAWAATFLALSFIMFSWIAIVLVLGHFRSISLIPFSSGGAAVALAIAWLGRF